MSDTRTPRELIDEADQARAQADDLEAAAIRAALGASAGNLSRAAVLLGRTYGWLASQIRPGRRHEALAPLATLPPGRQARVLPGANPAPQDLRDPAKRASCT